ncbi:hypothetical protein QRX50_19915 [Amycolatopsis carbonis]|uniref:Uncharacterized protein n=1 Tax=Amycolatopsis carbonis TaxID=715471 RepID=A0A9Y2IPF4_9PSEU|nr:hypothetical protein [Amycolatopsis sp. 2-15]WIX82875.1 hypothetical protein QRX50_19915 [Amycolatopsis sp. 2-15]
MFTERLASSTRGLYFTARFEGVWRLRVSSRRQSQPDQAARSLLTCTAANVAARTPITHLSTAQAEINASLGRLGAPGAEIAVHDASATVTVEPETLRQARHHEQLVREQELADATQERELRRLQRFRDTVLTDPGAAMSYWFMQHPDQLDEGVYDKITHLITKISEHDPSMSWLHVARILDAFIRDLDVADKQALLKLLSDEMVRFGNKRMADEVASHLPENQ